MGKGDEFVVFGVGDNELAIHTSATEFTGVVGITFMVKDVAALERHLTDVGIPFEGPAPMRPGLEGITVRDPNGNVLGFLQPAAK